MVLLFLHYGASVNTVQLFFLDCCVVQDKKFENMFDAFDATCAASDTPKASDNANVTVYWVQTTKEN
jgi:hypothetical protein